MRSQQHDLRRAAVALRKEGQSFQSIHRHLGIPLSTLSGWLKNIELSAAQLQKLEKHQLAALQLARAKASDWHHAQKTLHKLEAKQAAEATLQQLEPTNALLDLALALLYFGEGAKTDRSNPVASSNPAVLRFYLYVLKHNYGITPDQIHCELRLRADQDETAMKQYWSRALHISEQRFKHTTYDRRRAGTKTYDTYKGVCIVRCGNVAIQRKLVYLYSLFCEKIAGSMGD